MVPEVLRTGPHFIHHFNRDSKNKVRQILNRKRTGVDPETRAQLDDSLCQLVDRLEPGLRLEVEFRAFNASVWWRGEQGFKKRLPRSYEKGVRRGAPADEGIV